MYREDFFPKWTLKDFIKFKIEENFDIRMSMFNFRNYCYSVIKDVNDVFKIVTCAVIAASAVKCFKFGS